MIRNKIIIRKKGDKLTNESKNSIFRTKRHLLYWECRIHRK